MFRWVVLLAMFLGAPVAAQNSNDGARAVIGAQIEAFLVDDFETAFGFASPTIRQLFGNPEFFGQMVMNGYPMVWRPSEVQFANAFERDGRTYQRVLLRDRTGRGYIATYEMVKLGDDWRINGVSIETDPGAGA